FLFILSKEFATQWSQILEDSGRRIIYFGPGTGFGAGNITILRDNNVQPVSGNQAFFDILIRDGKTAEDLLTGNGLGKIAQLQERENIKKGKPIFIKYTEDYEKWIKDPEKLTEIQIKKISSKLLSEAYYSKNMDAKEDAKKIFKQAGIDLAKLMIQLYKGKGEKSLIKWNKEDWDSVKGVSIFLTAGLLIKPIGKEIILPSARDTLERSGYSDKIKIIEMDSLPAMRKIHSKIGLLGSSLIVPSKDILKKKWENSIISGQKKINNQISYIIKNFLHENKRSIQIAIDGYAGILWEKRIQQIIKHLQKDGFHTSIINFSSFYKSPKEIEKKIIPFMAHDNTFGRIFSGKLEDFLDQERIKSLIERFEKYKKENSKSTKVIICYGPGAACKSLRSYYDIILYKDITHQEITKRYQKGEVVPLGSRGKDKSGKGQPAYLAGKRLHYIDFPVLDKHKKYLQKQIDYYIDDNISKEPKLINREILDEIIFHFTNIPFQLKAFHDQGIWGGQWLKKVRNLPKKMINCAWAYELMAYHMSVRIPVGDTFIEMPFANILDKEPKRIMGERINNRFKGVWPIRINYDDCWKGGDMAIQIHPDSSYIKKQFKESLHQDESYYIMAASPDAYVHLGLKENIEISEFYDAVRKAETEGIPFDHLKYVNIFPAKEGDLFLIPAGTVHASGKGCVVLELSSTTDRYTLHIYDYLRPDLNGKLREIHSEHAFNMIKKYPNRNTSWVKKHLIQKPRIIRKGKDWAEYIIGKLEELVFEAHRFEFATVVEDDTRWCPHVLSLAKGNSIAIQSQLYPDRQFILNFTETVIVPACFGKYKIINQGNEPCKVLKTMVNDSYIDGNSTQLSSTQNK
ncbi:MAG: class I mannose-6-phosphate isomerase, partial [Spirochaetota bacterium]|nr:class I mannose-6-phosphate isomerase [Spirochaetota bacterium]